MNVPWIATNIKFDSGSDGEQAHCSRDVVNPNVWAAGTRLYIILLQRYPDLRSGLGVTELECIAHTGAILQKLYRSILVSASRFDSGHFWNLLEQYQSAASAFLTTLDAEIATLNFPLMSPDSADTWRERF